MTLLDVWLPAAVNEVYDTEADLSTFEGCPVRVGKRVIGYVEEVLEVRPEGIKIRLAMNGDKLLSVDEVS